MSWKDERYFTGQYYLFKRITKEERVMKTKKQLFIDKLNKILNHLEVAQSCIAESIHTVRSTIQKVNKLPDNINPNCIVEDKLIFKKILKKAERLYSWSYIMQLCIRDINESACDALKFAEENVKNMEVNEDE